MGNNENFEFSQKLNRLVEQARTLTVKYNSIALYGYGLVGQLLVPYLGSKLVAVVDQSAEGSFLGHLAVTKPDQLKDIKAECVVIAVLGREAEIREYLDSSIHWKRDIYAFDMRKSLSADRMPLSAGDKLKLSKLKNRFQGERCFIVGNGPSLNHCDLSLLEKEYTFGVNGIFYKTQEMGFKPTFYVVEDNHVVDDNIDDINQFNCDYKFFPSIFQGQISSTENTYFFNYDRGFFMKNSPHYCTPRFSFDAAEEVFAGQTVTYTNIQLATYLGFKEIYLIGVDFSYSVPQTTVIQGDTYISQEDDPNHFHPEYFGKGKKWHDPKLDRVLLNYEHARKVLDPVGVKVINATKGGKLEVFPRASYDTLLRVGCELE